MLGKIKNFVSGNWKIIVGVAGVAVAGAVGYMITNSSDDETSETPAVEETFAETESVNETVTENAEV